MNGEITKPEKNINGRLRDFPGIDSKLELAGMAADAKATGDIIRQLCDGHNAQNREIKKLRGYINGMLQVGVFVLTLTDQNFDDLLPGRWLKFGETIPIMDGEQTKYKIWGCVGDLDSEEAYQGNQ